MSGLHGTCETQAVLLQHGLAPNERGNQGGGGDLVTGRDVGGARQKG